MSRFPDSDVIDDRPQDQRGWPADLAQRERGDDDCRSRWACRHVDSTLTSVTTPRSSCSRRSRSSAQYEPPQDTRSTRATMTACAFSSTSRATAFAASSSSCSSARGMRSSSAARRRARFDLALVGTPEAAEKLRRERPFDAIDRGHEDRRCPRAHPALEVGATTRSMRASRHRRWPHASAQQAGERPRCRAIPSAS